MPITSKPAKGYTWRTIIVAVVSVVLGVWGIYDYAVAIPRQFAQVQRFEQITKEREELEATKAQRQLSTEEGELYDRLTGDLNAMGGTPSPPGKYDRLINGLLFVPCLPFGLYLVGFSVYLCRRTYRLDDDGTLHLPQGAWKSQEITDIDMGRWMKKSIAHVVHANGQRAKLDDYQYRDMFRIVGAIAARLHPNEWDTDAKLLKPASADPVPEAGATGTAASQAESSSGSDGADG